MRDQWWIHGHINFVLLSSSAFCDLYDKVMQPDESTESYRTLQGYHTRSVDAARGLWALSRTVVANPALRELFETEEDDELLAALDESEEGREFRRQLDEFLFEFGWRSDAVYDLADVPWREDPSIPLASVKAMIDLDESEDPEVQYQHNVAAREQLLANLREKLADDPETLAKFDELYEAAQYSFPLTEDHAFYIDQLYISVFRRFVLAIGDRLVAKGVFDAADDVHFLYRDEVVDGAHQRRRSAGDRRRAAGELRAGRRGQRPDRAGHSAAPAGRARSVHGCPRLPPARDGAPGGEHRPQCAQGRRRIAGFLYRPGARVPIPVAGDRRPRGG